jgi:nitrate reductase NapAB chaperone NapD
MKSLVVVRQSSASKDLNTEAEEATALEGVTRQRLVKTQQTEYDLYVL